MTPPRETIIDRAEGAANFCALRGDHGRAYAIAIRQLIAALATETAQREAAERALEAVTERIMRALVDGTRESLTANGLNDALDLVRRIADGGRAWRDTAGREHARLTAALTEAQRERGEARS